MARLSRHVGSDAATIAMARAVRRRVFIEEQGVDEAIEMDGEDDTATHVVLAEDSTPIATARVRFPAERTAKIERVAVVADERGQGVGVRVMAVAESVASDRGAVEAILHSQTRVQAFYERLGYKVVGDAFEEAGIPHVEMRKSLD